MGCRLGPPQHFLVYDQSGPGIRYEVLSKARKRGGVCPKGGLERGPNSTA